MLEFLFGNKTAVQVLLYLEKRKGAYATEISQKLKIPLNMVQKQLERFERGGVLVSEYQHRRKIYSWNSHFPLHRELKKLLARASRQVQVPPAPRAPLEERKISLQRRRLARLFAPYLGPKKWIIALLFLLIPSGSLSQNTGVSGTNLELYRPSIDPFGYFGVNSPRLMKPGQYYFKISQSLTGRHLFQIAVGTTPVDLVDRIYTTNFVGALGVSKFLTIGVDIPIHFHARESDFATLAPFTTSSIGDVRMALKFRLLEEKGKRPGLALLFSNTFPTGDEMKFLGTSHMVPGFELIVGKDLKYFNLSANIGARFPQQKNVLGITFNDQFTYGAAVKVPFGFWDPLFSVVGEIRGHVQTDRAQILTAPVEFTAGLQKEFRNGLTIQAGGGGAWNNAIGNPRFRALFAISYSPPKGRYDDVAWKKEEEEEREELEEIAREKERLEKKAERRRALEEARRERDRLRLEEEERRLEERLERERARQELEELKREGREAARRERELQRQREADQRREETWEREETRREREERLEESRRDAELRRMEQEKARLERELEERDRELAWRREKELRRQKAEEERWTEEVAREQAREEARERARLEAELRRTEREKARLEEELRQRERELAWKREKELQRQKEEEERWTEKSLKDQAKEEARRQRELERRERESRRLEEERRIQAEEENRWKEKILKEQTAKEAERERERRALTLAQKRQERERLEREEREKGRLEKDLAARERERRRRWEQELKREEREDAKWKKRMIREEEQLEREEKRLARKKTEEGLRVEKELRKRAKQEAKLKDKAEKEAIEALHKKARTTVYFQTGSKRPTKESRGWINEVADLMKRHPKKLKKILIEGHTDSIGGRKQNLRLSIRRAERVKEKLLRQGIEPERVEIQGQGEEQPVASNKTATGRRLNRRAEIMVKK
jgi:outer membrane protein OmpA-like peptidoglycan-associated protein